MTKRHNDIFDAVLSGVPQPREDSDKKERSGARFLKRGNAISEKVSGLNEEKTLHWVEPDRCKMWAQHNRDYALLTENNCSDLIEGIRAQGRQEFPAIVRRIDSSDHDFEVICGARRHYAVSWLQANNYPQFKYLVEVRDLSDEQAFRLADIENRDREDISDYERAVDYAAAVKLYYGGKQKTMAQRLEVSEVWLSRYLELARLPEEVVAAFPSKRDVRELHARTLKPLLKAPKSRVMILAAADKLAQQQEQAREGRGPTVDASKVIAALKSATVGAKVQRSQATTYRGKKNGAPVYHTMHNRKHRLEFDKSIGKDEFMAAIEAYLKAQF